MEDVFVMILTIAMVVALVLTVLHAYKNLPLRQGTKLICCVAIVFFAWTGILAYWIYYVFIHKKKQMPENKVPELRESAPKRLKVYAGSEHNNAAQQPIVLD